MTNSIDWNEVRKEFPVVDEHVYLNAAGAGAVSSKTCKAACSLYEHMMKHGDMDVWEKFAGRIEEIRQQVASFINADPEEIMFTINTAHGINIITDLLRNKAGALKGKGEVVTMDDEFPSSTLPWLHKGYDVKFVKPENCVYSRANIENVISESTDVLFTSHVQFGTGFRQDIIDLGQMCQEKDLVYIVNATQSITVFPIDVQEIRCDFLVFSGLKWPATGFGVGAMYVNKKWLNVKNFPVIGWRSMEVPFNFDNKCCEFENRASAMEVGCPHYAGIFALGASFEAMAKIRPENSGARLIELVGYLIQGLEEIGIKIVSSKDEKYRSGIIVVKVDDPAKIVAELRSRNIIVAKRGELLRISPHIYNNEADIDCFN